MDCGTNSNKRIAKNTIALYCRTLVVMLITLYSSRVVLRALGVEDYGIYNVVGGIVLMLSFLTTTLSSASQRYIAYELPKNNNKRLKETFSLILLSYGIVALIIFVLAELIGVWFLNSFMNIPADRLVAANWVFQASIFIFLFNFFRTPYMAVIIAHERMSVYAYISIADAALKLLSAYLIQLFFYDSLIVYALLILLCSFLTNTIYCYICTTNYEESRYFFYYDHKRLKEIVSYTWWSMIGPIATIIRTEGINILLNLFFGPAINAARAIANQVNTGIGSLSSNFFIAIKPQIVKSYSSGDEDRMRYLINSSSRLSFYLLLFLAIPIYFDAENVLDLWLVHYPAYSVVFVKLIIILSLIEAFNSPMVAGLIATGQIKRHQQIIAVIYVMSLPISAILLYYGYSPEYTLYVNMVLAALSITPRLFLCKRYYNLNIRNYVKCVLLRCFLVFSLCYLMCFF